ncbi:MAG: PfkB family carbohydrate kinase [Pseudolysinimonas sp.]
MTSVAIVGSANLDLVLSCERRPRAGETLIGNGYLEAVGGKGVNQALAVAPLAASALVAAVGNDSAARRVEGSLHAAGLDMSQLMRTDLPTGRAFVTLTPDGENSILVLPLANSVLTAGHVRSALDRLQPDIVLMQFEIPVAAASAAADWSFQNGRRLVVNASPVRPVSDEILRISDPLIVNAAEAADVLDDDAHSDVERLAERLGARCRSAVVTAGADGALVVESGTATRVEGHRVTVTDTTGAGDAFAGTLVGHLARGASLVEATERANAEAARVVQLERSLR